MLFANLIKEEVFCISLDKTIKTIESINNLLCFHLVSSVDLKEIRLQLL